MMLFVSAIAEMDISEAASWYEKRKDGLGFEFLEAVDEGIRRIADSPSRFPKVYGEGRRCKLERFPYNLWFIVEGHTLVVACMHAARSPELAKKRVNDPEPKS